MVENNSHHFWHRRIAQIAIGIASCVLVLFAVALLGEGRTGLDAAFTVGILSAAFAGVTILITGLSFIPRLPEAAQKSMPLAVQVSLAATVAVLVYTTGGFSSPFLVLWLPAVMFVGIFGVPMLLVVALVPILYAGWLIATDALTPAMGASALLTGGIPPVLSYLLFSRVASNREDTTYRQLASQYSQVSDKSEVVITAITDGVIAIDKKGVIELINPAAQRLIGWESRDALKLDYRSVLKLIDAESNELTQANDPVYTALSTNKEVRTDELTLITNSGKKLLISLVASPVGQLGSGIIIVFRDITKEKAEEREQAEFISTASHEMRTPVASIEGYLGLALNPATAQIDEKARMYITKAHEVAQHLGRLFQDLLDITKAEDGRLSNNPRAVEVVSFVQDVVEGLRPQAEAKGLVLVYKPLPDDADNEKSNRRLNPVYYANVDNDHFREVIGNLVENAIKYTQQGTISVDVTGDDKQIQVSVADTGIGIPAEDLPHLFQKFYRVDNSDTREIGGTGLGLYLSRRLAEAMEGRMWAESRHGQGSTFFISVPRISHEEAMQLIETLDDESAKIGTAVSGQTITPTEAAATFAASPAPAPAPVLQQAPEPAPAPLANEGVFVSPPAEVIAAQLGTAPAPTAPQPIVQPTPGSSSPSLAAIEQDPEHYLTQAAPMSAPAPSMPITAPSSATSQQTPATQLPPSPLRPPVAPPPRPAYPPSSPQNQNQP